MGLFSGLGELAGGIASLAGAGGRGGKDEMNRIAYLWDQLQTGGFDMSSLDAPELQMVAEMMPVLREGITPESAPQIAGSPEMRREQLASLAGMRDVATRGTTDVDRLSAQQAQLDAARAGRQQREALLSNLAGRGQLGGGQEIAARLGGLGQQANLQADMGAQLARDAALRRLSAMSEAGSMAGGIRGQDVAQQEANAGLTSRFNELVYGILNNAAAANQQAQQAAQGYNVGMQQDIANLNVGNRYNTALQNLERQNRLRQAEFQQQLAKLQGQTGALQKLGGFNEGRKSAREQGIYDIGGGIGTVADAAIAPFGGLGGIFGAGGGGQMDQNTMSQLLQQSRGA